MVPSRQGSRPTASYRPRKYTRTRGLNIRATIVAISPPRLVEHLYQQFGEELNTRFLEEEGINLKEVLEFLWHMVDRANKDGSDDLAGKLSLMDEELLAKYLDALKNESILTELDENETNECGISSLFTTNPRHWIARVTGIIFDICIITEENDYSYKNYFMGIRTGQQRPFPALA